MGSPLGVRMPRRGTTKRQYASGNDQNTLLLLHGNSFVDHSVSGNSGSGDAIANAGVTISSTLSKVSTNSLVFTSGSYLQFTSRYADFVFGSGDFTIEGNFLFNSVADTPTIMTVGYAYYIQGAAGALNFVYYSGGATYPISSPALSTSQWYNIAWCRDLLTLRGYVNGVQTTSRDLTSIPTMDASSGNVYLGGYKGGGYSLFANIDEFRVSNVCRYKGGVSYTPPAFPFGPDAR